jgi:hypothetical protein
MSFLELYQEMFTQYDNTNEEIVQFHEQGDCTSTSMTQTSSQSCDIDDSFSAPQINVINGDSSSSANTIRDSSSIELSVNDECQVPASILSRNSKYITFKEMERQVQEYARINGFTSARTTNSFSVERAKALFGDDISDPIIQRGAFYCTHRNPQIKERTSCLFDIAFTYSAEERCYVIKKFIPDHNHDLLAVMAIPGQIPLINLEHELQADEIQEILHLSKFHLSLQKVREILRSSSGREYSTPLLSRLMARGRKIHYGPDPDAMNHLISWGLNIKSNGGIFDVEVSQAGQITKIFVQTSEMLEYAKVYNDFTLADGTHNCTSYDLKLVPFMNVDGLGYSNLTAFHLSPSELGADMIKSLKLFNLAKVGGVLMTDGHPSYPSTASQLNTVHILCMEHFRQDIFPACAGLGLLSDRFKKECNALIFEDFQNENIFLNTLDEKIKIYKQHLKAYAYLLKLQENKEKVCRYYTSKLFL